MKRLLAFLMSAGLAVSYASAETDKFQVQGTNPGGTGSYRGTVELTQIEGTGAKTPVFKVVYTLSNGIVEAIAMVSPSNKDALIVAFPDGSTAGVLAIVRGDSSANGEWFAPSAGKVGQEVWTSISGGVEAPAAPVPAGGMSDYDHAVDCAAATGYVVSSMRALVGADQTKLQAYDASNTAWVNRLGDVAGGKSFDQRIADIQARQAAWAAAPDGADQATRIADDCVANPPPASE